VVLSGTACWTAPATKLTAAEALDHEHPMISVLRRRLKIEVQQKKEPTDRPRTARCLPTTSSSIG